LLIEQIQYFIMYTDKVTASFVVMNLWRHHDEIVLLFVWEMKSLILRIAQWQFLLKERCKATAIHQRLVAVYGDSAITVQ